MTIIDTTGIKTKKKNRSVRITTNEQSGHHHTQGAMVAIEQ